MHPVHLHLALNHIPVLGTLFLLIWLVVAWIRRDQSVIRQSLWGIVVLMLVSIPIKFTGDNAEESLSGEPISTRERITHHETAADRATTGIFVAGLFAAGVLFKTRKEKSVSHVLLAIMTALLVATFALMALTANSGGAIRHPEVRQSL